MNMNTCFCELSDEEAMMVDGGVIGTICAVIGTVLAAGTAVYGIGYARGQNAGYKEKYAK